MSTTIQCSKCRGKGRVTLSEVMSGTLAYVVAGRFSGVSPANTAEVMGIRLEAACNRLERLRNLGLARRIGNKGNALYFPK